MRRRSLLFSLLLLVVAVSGAAARTLSAAIPQPQLTLTVTDGATAAGPALPWPKTGSGVLVLQGVGTVGAHRPDLPLPIASLAKVMTAVVVLSDHPLRPGEQGPPVPVTAADAADFLARIPSGQSLLAVQPGERLTERQALEGLLLPSANNIADILARWDGGRSTFLARMNATAQRAGATSTRYTDPSGLDPATVSTATNQVRIATLALRVPGLIAIAAERTATLPVAGRVRNYNRLLSSRAGVFGLKTGSTPDAGGCLVLLARLRVGTKTVTVVGALLGVHRGEPPLIALDAALTAASSLLKAARVQARPVVPAGLVVARLRTAWGPQATVVVSRPPLALMLPGEGFRVSGRLRCNPPASSGHQVRRAACDHRRRTEWNNDIRRADRTLGQPGRTQPPLAGSPRLPTAQ